MRLPPEHPRFTRAETIRVGRATHQIPPGCTVRFSRPDLVFIRTVVDSVHALNEDGEVPISEILMIFVLRKHFPEMMRGALAAGKERA